MKKELIPQSDITRAKKVLENFKTFFHNHPDEWVGRREKYEALITALKIISAYEQQEKQLALYKETLIEIRKQLIGGTYNTSIRKALDIAQQALKGDK